MNGQQQEPNLTQPEPLPLTCYWDATDGEVKVYKIDDGEQHWYVASGFVAALKEHYDMLGGCDNDHDADSITISVEPADKKLTRREIEGINNPWEVFPPTFELREIPNSDPTATATAADWAAYYQKSAPVQLMSSVF